MNIKELKEIVSDEAKNVEKTVRWRDERLEACAVAVAKKLKTKAYFCNRGGICSYICIDAKFCEIHFNTYFETIQFHTKEVYNQPSELICHLDCFN